MSVSFFIKNKTNILKVKEILEISENLEQFSFDETEKDFNPEEFYNLPISEIEVLILGEYGKSARGFELAYEKTTNSYSTRISTPSSKEDWKIMLKFLKKLSIYLENSIVSEEGENFSNTNIENFSFEHDIEYGIKVMHDNIKNGMDILEILGVLRPVSFNEEILDKILSSNDKIEEFSKIITDLQYLDAYSARQSFYKKEDESIFGTYVLSENLRTILPYKPFVEYQNSSFLKTEDISEWKMSFVGIKENGEYFILGELDYTDFIEKLPKHKYQLIDASYILLEALSSEEIKKLSGFIN